MKRKKLFKSIALSLMTMLLFSANVYAEQKVGYTPFKAANGITLTQGDAEEDIDVINVTVNVNQDTIDSILSQKPGHEGDYGEASLGIYFVGIKPTNSEFAGKTLDKHFSSAVVVDGNRSKALNQAKEEALTNAKNQCSTNKHDDNDQVWEIGVLINYKKDGKWQTIEDTGKGKTTIKEKLEALTGKSELKYGEDYIFSVPTDTVTVWAYRYSDTSNCDGNVEVKYVTFKYELNFDIEGKKNGKSYYFDSFEEALKEAKELGITEIAVNKDVTVEEKLTVPAGVTVKVKENKTLTLNNELVLEEGAKVEGTVVNEENIIKPAPTTPSTPSTPSTDTSDKKDEEENKETVITENVTYIDNGEGLEIEGSIVTGTNDATNETYTKMVDTLKERGYTEIYNMYEFHVKDNKSLTKLLTITFDLGEKNNGRVAYILHQKHDGTYEEFENTVENGKVSITVKELSPFVVALKDKEEDNQNTVTDNNTTNNAQTASQDIIKYGILTSLTFVGFIALVKNMKKEY